MAKSSVGNAWRPEGVRKRTSIGNSTASNDRSKNGSRKRRFTRGQGRP